MDRGGIPEPLGIHVDAIKDILCACGRVLGHGRGVGSENRVSVPLHRRMERGGQRGVRSAGVQAGRVHDVHRTPQMVLQEVLDRDELDVGEARVAHVDQHVDIAVCAGFVPGHRAEQCQRLDTASFAQLGFDFAQARTYGGAAWGDGRKGSHGRHITIATAEPVHEPDRRRGVVTGTHAVTGTP